jgi:S-adenosylmethionine decarboxylase
MEVTLKNIAPEIFRQRLIIEGYYSIEITKEILEKYLIDIAENLNLRIYGDPIIFSPSTGMGKEENAGFDAFVPLIDSGISAYIWSKARFFSIVIYTCKGFDEGAAVDFTKDFFSVTGELVNSSF